MKKRCPSPLPSAGAELAVAATGRSLPKWSSCFCCSCRCETGWVFERAWTGAGHLLLSWDNCACCLSENKGKYVGGEQESPVSGQLWEFKPRDGKLPVRLPDHDISNTGHGETRAFVTREIPRLSLVQNGTEPLQTLLVQYFSLFLVIMWFTEDF